MATLLFRASTILLGALLLLSGAPAWAQEIAAPTPGDRIRIRLQGSIPAAATLLNLTPDSIIYAPEQGVLPEASADLASVADLWVQHGTTTIAILGAGAGALAGLGMGGLIGSSTLRCDEERSFSCRGAPTTHRQAATIGALIGVSPGTIAGAFIGSSIARERWRRVAPPFAMLVSTPARGRIVLRLSLASPW